MHAAVNVDRPPTAAVYAARQVARFLRLSPIVVQTGDFIFAFGLRAGNWPEFFGIAPAAAPGVAAALETLRFLPLREAQLPAPGDQFLGVGRALHRWTDNTFTNPRPT